MKSRTPLTPAIVKIGQGIFISLLIAGLILGSLKIFDPTQYVTLEYCTQLSPWNTECITTTVTIDEFQRSLETTQSERFDSE